MPEAQVRRLHEVVMAALREPELGARIADQGGIPREMTIAEFRAFVAEETGKFTRIIDEAKITPEG
jgi:tripartite-type tricarboxylate transporter receptor subunit TctC